MKNSTVIKLFKETDRSNWDNFVNRHPNSNIYHLAGWKNVIERTYGHKTYYLMAFDSKNVVKGILYLSHSQIWEGCWLMIDILKKNYWMKWSK